MSIARISSRHEQGWTVVEVAGELDLASAPEFRRITRAAAQPTGEAPRVVVDLRFTELLDSVSLGVLLGLRRRVLERDGVLRLVIEEDRVLRTLELTGTATLFDVVRTVDSVFTP